MRHPANEFIPVWYELGFKGSDTILIRIHRAVIGGLKIIKKDLPYIKDFAEAFSSQTFPEFIEPSETEAWGFGKVLVPSESGNPDWIVYECKLPVFKNDEWLPNDYAIRSTLSVLFLFLQIFEGETDSALPQLIVISNLRVDNGIYGGAICAELAPTVAEWLSKKDENFILTEVEECMVLADKYMFRYEGRELYRSDFRVNCQKPKWVHLNVPGNSCGLDPDYYRTRDNDLSGYKLTPHNTDSSLHQLTLLVGLAKLHELVRKG